MLADIEAIGGHGQPQARGAAAGLAGPAAPAGHVSPGPPVLVGAGGCVLRCGPRSLGKSRTHAPDDDHIETVQRPGLRLVRSAARAGAPRRRRPARPDRDRPSRRCSRPTTRWATCRTRRSTRCRSAPAPASTRCGAWPRSIRTSGSPPRRGTWSRCAGGPACHVLGAQAILRGVVDRLGLDGEGDTADGAVWLKYNTCLGVCPHGAGHELRPRGRRAALARGRPPTDRSARGDASRRARRDGARRVTDAYRALADRAAETWARLHARPWVRVGTGLLGMAAGAYETLRALREEVARRGIAATVSEVGPHRAVLRGADRRRRGARRAAGALRQRRPRSGGRDRGAPSPRRRAGARTGAGERRCGRRRRAAARGAADDAPAGPDRAAQRRGDRPDGRHALPRAGAGSPASTGRSRN